VTTPADSGLERHMDGGPGGGIAGGAVGSRAARDTAGGSSTRTRAAGSSRLPWRDRRSAALAVGLGVGISAFLLEAGLRSVVGDTQLAVAPFAGIVTAALLGGPAAGTVAAVVSLGLTWSLAITGSQARPDARFAVDTLTAVAGVVLGLALRGLTQPRPSIRHVEGDGAATARRSQSTIEASIEDLTGRRSATQVADALARHTMAITGASAASVHVAAAADHGFVLRAAVGGSGAARPWQRLDPERDLPPGAIAGRLTAWDGDLALPIVAGTTVVGVVRLVGAEPGRTVASGRLLAALSRLAGDAIERERLRVENASLGDTARSAQGRAASLGRLAAALAGEVALRPVATAIVDHAVDVLGATFGLLYIQDRSGGPHRLIHARGYPVGLSQREATLTADHDGPVARASRTREIVSVDDPEAWRRAFPGSSDVPAMTGARSIVAMPLGDDDPLDGVLVLGWPTDGAASRVDPAILGALADLGVQAIQRARLHAQEQQAIELQEAFVGVISHELRTPITTILAGSRLLQRRLPADTPPGELAVDIEAEADRLVRIVDDLLVLSRIEGRHLAVAEDPIHLSHLLQRIVKAEAARWPTRRFVAPRLGSVHLVRGEETYVEQVLRNLLSNAAKYSPPGSAVEVQVVPAGDEIEVRVLDEGMGIARDEVEKLFSLFYRSPSTRATAAGAGIGLFVSRRLVDEMGGRMWARQRPEGGSEFGFSLLMFPIEDEEDTASGVRKAPDAPRVDPTDNGGSTRSGGAS
jgi:K+-sensing histidine kinase KdpD